MVTRRTFLGAAAVCGAVLTPTGPAHAASAPLLISVLTCRRPRGVSYLAGTLASVDVDVDTSVSRLLVCDGDEVIADGWTSAVVPPRPRASGRLPDNKVPGWVAIKTAAAMGADLLFLEDDIRPLHRGAFAAMVAHEVPAGAAFASFFSRMRTPGMHGVADFQLSQAVKIPNRSLGVLANAEKSDPLQWSMVIGVDIAISAFGRSAGWRFEQTQNFIEHIGLWSAANPT